ncbi:MAG: type II secretion system protein [Planctomycetota bacterium]
MAMRRMTGRSGFTLVEAVVSLAILAIITTISLIFVVDMQHADRFSRDRAFATQKAISLLEEVRRYAQEGGVQDAAGLDPLDDGLVYNPVLTIQDIQPGEQASANQTSPATPSGWRFSRRLVVRPFAGVDTRDVRIVSAMVYLDQRDGTHALLADVGTVLRTPADAYPSTQVYDVYFLSLENIPGWWVYMSNIKPLMEATVTDLQARNPGLVFRAHWITKSSYGRDFMYVPCINEEVDSYQDVNWVYFYPGAMPSGSSSDHYYVANQIAARMSVDGTETGGYNGDATSPSYNPWPYSLADEYNHGMRYIDEVRYFNLRRGSSLEDDSAPTWRILLERMCSNPASFENAILINLHGELVPMPAMRNYSDPAKDPSTSSRQGVRVVTHPRYLRTPVATDLQVRVYAYRDPYENLSVTDSRATAEPISVVIKNVNLTGNVNGATNPTLTIQKVYGGVDGSKGDGKDGQADQYGVSNAPLSAGADGNMWASAQYVEHPLSGTRDTVITLYNTPLTCYYFSSSSSPNYRQGLSSTWQFYGLEYIPSATESAGDFSQNLSVKVDNPKNTARWIITIPAAMRSSVLGELTAPYDGVAEAPNRLTFETCIGTDLSVGVMWPPASRRQPTNLSRTYAWWTNSAGDVPFTERSQFIGDPRHCPYADLKNASPVLSFQNHYNWWFDNFKNSSYNVMSNWPGYGNTRIENDEGNDVDGWADHQFKIDVPRYLELLRTALMNTDSVYTTLTGYCYYYLGIGNEIGYDSSNGYSSSVPVSRKPFYGTSGSRTEQVITDGAQPSDASTIGTGTKLIKRGRSLSSGYWWGKTWLGELYPDDDWTAWSANGNLPTGSTSSTYVRMRRESIAEKLPRGTTFTLERRCMEREGCNSFFLVGTRSSTFHHEYQDGASGSLVTSGQEIAQDYAFPLPTTAAISRPFRPNMSSPSNAQANPDFDFTSDFPHNSMQYVRVYYNHPWGGSSGNGSALMALTNPSGTHSSFQVINGIDRTIESGSGFIAKWALLSLVHSFLTAGEPDTDFVAATRIEQLPRVVIKQPTIITEIYDPDDITVQWSSEFLRWDGEKYTQYYPDGFTENDWQDDLRYVLMYSTDSGDTWRYMLDRTPATPGRCPPGTYLIEDEDPNGDELYAWSVPRAIFPEGSYIIRIEAYRTDKILHYSQHQEKIYIDR